MIDLQSIDLYQNVQILQTKFKIVPFAQTFFYYAKKLFRSNKMTISLLIKSVFVKFLVEFENIQTSGSS